MTPWLELCRAAAGDVQKVLDGMPSRSARERSLGTGAGGDETTAVDGAAEAAVVARLEELHARGIDFGLVSEEAGERSFGRGSQLRVVLDPIDGSVNATRSLPYFSLSVAVAEGPAMGDVFFGYVYDFGSGEEWTAERGKGARVDGKPLGDEGPREGVEMLALEATRPDLVAGCVARMVGVADGFRILGSLALALCHLAAGRGDAVGSLRAVRSVDSAAGQLLVRERGLAIDLPRDSPFADAALDLGRRSYVVAARTPEVCARISHALEG